VGRVLHAIEHDSGTVTALLGEQVSQWLGWGRRTIIEPLPSQPMATTAAASSAASAGSSPQARLQAAAMAQRGYRWGNGVELRWHLDERGQLAALRYVGAPRPMAWLDAWLPNAQAANEPSLIDLSYDYDAWGRMSVRAQDGVKTQFGYDALGRLLLAQPGDAEAQPGSPVEYYAYARGHLMASKVQGRDTDWRKVKTDRGLSGLPSRIETSQSVRALSYSPDNRLIEVSQGREVLARYAHNTHGQRINKAVGALNTAYLWHQGQLVGETVPQPQPQTKQATPQAQAWLARRYVYAHGVPVAVLDYSKGAALEAWGSDADNSAWQKAMQWAQVLWRALTTEAPELSYVHANEIGAPVAVTNAQGQVLWRASYTAFGQLDPVRTQGVAKPFVLNLRLPGQYFDAETGWHDNGLR
ncbi:MAG TPA: RHS domain-containing protein, partial [Aquabacterium sp.]|nr:RHS domain-containing protein [Aquabacterium sp.]